MRRRIVRDIRGGCRFVHAIVSRVLMLLLRLPENTMDSAVAVVVRS
jgi:hypothetical protein